MKKLTFMAAGIMFTFNLTAQIYAPGPGVFWKRGGNTGSGADVLGPTWAGSELWFTTDNTSDNRMVIKSSAAGGSIGFGNNLPAGFNPLDRLHSFIIPSGGVSSDNMFRFSNSANPTGGLRIGLDKSNIGLFDLIEKTHYRFDMTDVANTTQLTKFSIHNINQSNVTTVFQPTYTDAARVGIWEAGSYFPGAIPVSMMHIGSPSGVNSFTHRDWMNIGTYYGTNGTDGMYIGLKENTFNGADAIIAFGDDGAAAGTQGDRLKFIFNSNYTPGGPFISQQNDGLEVARMISMLGNDGAASFNGGSIGGLDPLNTVHIVGQSTAGNATVAGGNSGLRFEYLNTSTPTVANPGQGLLSVDANGDVIYVNCCAAAAAITAQNGLNMINPTTVELGGGLLHPTDVTMTHPITSASENLSFNGKGQFAITDYTTAPNSQASNLAFGYKFGVFTDNVPVASKVENIRPSTSVASSPVYGEQITVNANVNAVFGFPTIGELVNVKSDGAGIYGVAASADPNTFSTSSTGAHNVVGVQGVGRNGNHTYGGIFQASTVVSSPSPASTIGTYGVDVTATGGDLEALGGIFRAKGARYWNKGIYAIARVDPSEIGKRSMGVHALADGGGGGGYNLGVFAVANEFDPTKTSTTAVGVCGILGSNSWGLNYLPVGLRAGVFGTSQFASTFGSGSLPVWAGFFNGNIFHAGALVPSDRTLKKDIKTLENSLDIIKKLNPVSYKFIEENKLLNLPTEKQYGFISQEVKEILPELTSEINHGGYRDSLGNQIVQGQTILGLNYNGFIAILTEGIKEQQNIIETQNEKIDDLQKQINELKDLITATPSSTSDENGTSQINVELSDGQSIVLDQNVPNPFAEQTTISYVIPEGTGKAQMLFHDASGKMIKVVDITEKGQGKLNVFANDLSNGTYTYTLIVDGKIIGTRKMEKQK